MYNFAIWLLYVLVCFIQMGFQGTLILLIFNKKFSIRKLLLFAFINSLANEIPRWINYNPLLNFAIYIGVMLITLKFILNFDFLRGLLATCCMIITSGILESIIKFILTVSLQDDYDVSQWTSSPINVLVFRQVGNLLYFLIAILVYYFKMKIIIPEDINKKRMLAIIINVLITVMLIAPNILFFEHTDIKLPVEVIIFNIISVFVLVALSIYNSIQSGELEMKKREIEFQNLYINSLVELANSLRGFKHDFNNVVQSLGGYLALDDLEGLKKYYDQMLAETRYVNNLMPISSYLTNNPALYGLLLSKISKAESKGINFNVNIMCDIYTGSIKIYDFCKVMGVLLDNAIEAASESEKKYAEICVRESLDKTVVIIEISNSFEGNVDVTKIFENGFSTKEGHSGFGLWEVKSICSKHSDCQFNTTVTKNIFTQTLKIFRQK